MVGEVDKNYMWNLSFKDSSFTIFRPSILHSGFLHLCQIIFPSSSSFFDGRSEDQIVPLQIVSSFFRSDRASSNHLFILPLQIRSCLFSLFKLFFPLFLFRFDVLQVQNRVFKTRDLCDILYQLTNWKSSL